MSDQPAPATPSDDPASLPLPELDPLLARHLSATKKKLDLAKNQRRKRLAPELSKKRSLSLAGARKVAAENHARRLVIQEKIESGIPITPEEREFFEKTKRTKKPTTKEAANTLIDMASKLVMKPQTVQALRLVVEQTAARHAYNPIDELIRLSKSPDLSDKDKVAVHKALMPFLIPQVAPAQADEETTPEDQRPKIVIKQFVVDQKDARPIHETKRDQLTGPVITVEPASSSE